jgi:cytochrome P450
MSKLGRTDPRPCGGANKSLNQASHFYPPHVKPSTKPLRFPFYFTKLLRNNLEIIPEQAYWQPIVIARGPPRSAFITDSEPVKKLLCDRATEFPRSRKQIDPLKPIAGNSMLFAEGAEWRWQRGAAAPLFRHGELLRYGPIMSAAAEAAVAKWRAAAPDTVHAIDKDMIRAAFHVVANTMLAGGAEDTLHAIEKGHTDYYRSVNWWVVYTILGLPRWLPRPNGKSMRAHENRLRETVAELVRTRRAATEAGDDLLARLSSAADAESGRSMSDDRLADNILLFLMTGTETYAFSLTWTLYLISQSPEWESRMVQEIERVAGSGPITSAHVEHLTIVQQVLNESLRLFPIVPMIIRDIVDDIEFEGISIPAGTIGIIPIYAIHRHRTYWEDPDRFDPGRFSPDNPKKPNRFQFMPFGVGPRMCIGAAFVMIEATIMLATFVRAAHFAVDDDFDPQPSGQLHLVPKNGMPMRVTFR